MFDKLKELKALQEQAKQMQNALASERITVSDSGVVITMDGNNQLVDIEIKEDLLNPEKKDKLQTAIKSAHRDVMKRVQKKMAEKMRASGMGFPGLG